MDLTPLQLGKKGFEFLKTVLGELRENRYAAQSVTHDYWAMAFQVGEFLHVESSNVDFFTEQEIQCKDDSLFPDWVFRSREHIPDGMTLIKNGKERSVIAIEVDLTIKPLLRYDKAMYYFDAYDSKTDIVFWLVDGVNVMNGIYDRLVAGKIRKFDIHHFVLLSDFKKLGWNAIARTGQFTQKSVHDIYVAKGWQTPPTGLSNEWQTQFQELFISSRKSPGRSKPYEKKAARAIS